MTKISIIIPVYNTEQYLEQCIDSILNQTLKDIEIILINDGSTDKSYNILKKYEKKDSRIVLINQKNKGLYLYDCKQQSRNNPYLYLV